MKNLKKVDWDPERIAALAIGRVQDLRKNALHYGDQALVHRCDADIARRSPAKVRRPIAGQAASRKGRFVSGFHFVCDRKKGVTLNPDGTFWTGAWVVDEAHADRRAKISAYVALHAAKAELSYRQGVIKAWRKVTREPEYAGRPVKIETGVDFLLEPTSDPHKWVGSGSGEKGYAWSGD